MARSLNALGRYDEARKILDEIDPDRPAKATALSVLGLIEMSAGDLDAAQKAFDAAARRGMRSAVFHNDRGRLALLREDYDRAEEEFEKAIAMAPSFIEARSNLAVAHRRAGRLDEAQEVLESLIDNRPNYGAAHFNLAEVLREELTDLDAPAREAKARMALNHYSRALELGFSPEQVIERRASLAAAVDDLDLAEEDFLKMAEDPEISGDVLHRLGRVKRDQGRPDIAQKLFEMAIERGADGAVLYSDYGGILLADSDFEGARRAFEAALERNPDLLITRVNLSIAWMELGDDLRAAKVLRPALRVAPDHPVVRAQRIQLEKLGQSFD